MKKYTCTGTHLSLSDRIFIENALAKQLNFKEIARYLQKDPTTVSKEIKRHRIEKIHGSSEYGIHCALEPTCKITDLCSNDYCENGSRCAICKLSNCTMYCDEYVPAVCEKLCRPPYVCNGCIKVRSCGYDKLFYRAKHADDSYHEMLMFLMESKTQECVKNVFDTLEEKLGTTLFQKLFTVILTDNGTEFQDPSSLEVNCDGEIRTKLFYCNPSQSWQKGQLERNHEFIRYIIPKGKTFDNLTDNQVLAMCNHINSLARESLNNSTPYAVAPILLDKDFMKKLGLHHIPHDEVLLKPILIKHY